MLQLQTKMTEEACIKMSNKMSRSVANMLLSHTTHQQTHTHCGGPGDALSHTHTYKHTPSEVSHRRVWAYGEQRGAVKPGEELSLQIAIVETAGKEHTCTPVWNKRLSTQSLNNLNKHTQGYRLDASRLL